MKTLLYTLAMVTLLALPILAEDAKPATSFDLSGRMAVGFTSTAGQGTAFVAPDVKVKAVANVDQDIKAVIRMNFDNGIAGGADMAYIKADNLLKKIGTPDAFNPEITVGKFKTNFGEEAMWNDPINGALISNSVADIAGYDVGMQLKQDLKIDMPVLLGVSLAFLNGSQVETTASKGYALKISGQMKENLPLSFSLSNYNSGKTTGTSVMEVMGNAMPALTGVWTRNIIELDARYDLEAKNFDPSKAPLFADAKGVFRLAFGQGSDAEDVGTGEFNYTYIMLDGIYNLNDKWYVAFRYSSLTDDDVSDNKWDRISLGGGVKLGENTMLKATYDLNGEPDVAGEDVDNDTVSIMMTTKW